MIRTPPFPERPEQLDPAIVATALGVPVSSMSTSPIGAERGMLGDLVLVRPEYPGEPGPEAVVAKFAADREASLATARRGGVHLRELRFYDELAVDTPVRVPHVHASWYDPDTARFLIIQEAIEVDTSIDQVAGIEIELAALVMVELARLHTRWWQAAELQDLDWLPRLDSQARRSNLVSLSTAGWEPLCELVGDAIAEDDRSIGSRLPDAIDDALRRLAELPFTLVHSDLRADNLLFSPDHGEVVLVDWQGCGIGPPSWDLAYFLAQSLDVEVRRAGQDRLIETYLAELATQGAPFGRDEALEGIGDAMLFGLAVACSLPVISDPTEPRVRSLATAMATRAIEGLRDHGVLDRLR